MLRSLSVLILIVACATPRLAAPPVAAPPPTSPPMTAVENDPLPPDPATEKLDGNIPPDNWVEPLEAGSCLDKDGNFTGDTKPCPARAGIVMSEAKAARAELYKTRYVELRTDYTADRKVWGTQRELYEKMIQLDDQQIRNLQPSWWDRHKADLGFLGGFVLGTAMTMAVYSIVR